MLGIARTAAASRWWNIDTNSYNVPGALTDDTNTALLMKFEGNFNDSNTSGRTAKTMSTADSPTTTSSVVKYGTQSLSIPASTTVLPRVYTQSAISDFYWYAQDFTVETWVYTTSFSDQQFDSGSNNIPKLMGNTTSNDYSWAFGFRNDAKLAFWYWNGSGQQVLSTTTFATNTWHHIVMDFRVSDGRIRVGANGAWLVTATKSGTPATGNQFTMGSVRLNSPQFYLDDLRVSKILRY